MFTRFLIAVTVARFAVYVIPVGLFFAAAATPSRARSVLAIASALTIGSGVGLWPVGRVLDRVGQWRGLRLAMLAGSGSMVLLAAAVWRAWPRPTVLAVATISGIAWSAVVAAPRALLPAIVGPSRMPWASGMEATSVEVALIVAPLAGAVLGQLGPAVTAAAGAGLLVVAATLLPRSAEIWRPTAYGRPVVARPVFAIAGLGLLLGLSGGLMEPGLAALPSAPFGDLAGNALLFVAVGVGSATGGLMAARSAWPSRQVHSVPLFALHAVALAGAATTGGLLRLGLLVVAGLPIAPLQSLGALLLDRYAEPTRTSETFGLAATILTLGTGLGQAIAAQTTRQLDPQHLVLLATAPPLIATMLVAAHLVRRGPRPPDRCSA